MTKIELLTTYYEAVRNDGLLNEINLIFSSVKKEHNIMKKLNKYLKNILYGFLAWLIPFVASFFFYTREGKLTIDIFLFKSIMIVVGSISAAILLVLYFRKINGDYLKEGIIVGLTWLGINVLLDLLVLIPMSGMSIADYFTQIGIRYLVIPVMSITVGAALENRK